MYRVPFLAIALLSTFVDTAIGQDWPSSLGNECQNPEPEWIWCEDFEIDRSADYFEGSDYRETATGIVGSTAAAFRFEQGDVGPGGFKIAFGRTPNPYMRPVDNGTRDYREVYWRMFVRFPENWVGNGADKLSRAMVLATPTWGTAMMAHVWSGPDPGPNSHLLLLDPASGTDASGNLRATTYNDFENFRWLGQKYGQYPIFASENFGKWHCVEAHVKLNDASSSNGIFQLYINDNLEAERTDLNWLGDYDDFGINAVFFENYWNNTSPVSQTRYFDNVVISTQRIGCGIDGPRPNPPSDVRISANY